MLLAFDCSTRHHVVNRLLPAQSRVHPRQAALFLERRPHGGSRASRTFGISADLLVGFCLGHFQPLTPAELQEIERLVNAEVRANREGTTRLMKYDEAVASGAMALFGEKYEDMVRVLSFGDFSTELCGGTHVRRTGDIGLFKIVSEGGIQSGVRRIEAVTGQGALDWVSKTDHLVRELASLVKSSREDVEDKVRQLVERSRKQEKEIAGLKAKLASGQGGDLSSGAVDIGGLKVVATRVDGADAPALRNAVDQLKNKLKSGAIVLAASEGEKVSLIAGVTQDLIAKIKAGELVNHVATQVGGKGGGRPDMAQAGGTDSKALPKALASVQEWVEQRL